MKKDLRPAIIRAHEQGRGVREIAEFLSITPMMVSRAIKRFEETGSNDDRPGRGRKKTARSKRNILRAKEMIHRNPTTKANSTRKLAKKLDVHQKQAWQILRGDLGLKPYKFQKRQKLTATTKKKRKDRAGVLLKRLSRGRHRKTLFTDEKLFDIQQVCVLFWHIVFSGLQPPERQNLLKRPTGKRAASG